MIDGVLGGVARQVGMIRLSEESILDVTSLVEFDWYITALR